MSRGKCAFKKTDVRRAVEAAQMTSEFLEHLHALKQKAYAGPIGKRQSSFELYGILSECYALALQSRRNETEGEALRLLVRNEKCDGKGRWTLRASDEFILVCRYVFPRRGAGKGELSNASRYAAALREAFKRQMAPTDFATFLKDRGGINALYLSRPLERGDVQTKTLYLDRQITASKDAAFSLTLRRMSDNRFEVLRVGEPA